MLANLNFTETYTVITIFPQTEAKIFISFPAPKIWPLNKVGLLIKTRHLFSGAQLLLAFKILLLLLLLFYG